MTTHAETDLTYWSHDYWLGHCEGFRVDAPDGRVGIVEAVLSDDDDEPTTLVVREGLFALRTIHVPVTEVSEVRPRAERIILSVTPEPLS